MIVFRFRQTFRARMPEWLLACGLAVWGSIVIRSPGLFDREFFQPLAHILPQEVWGWSALAVGMLRLIFLTINGSLRQSADLRAIGCWLSCIVWGGLLIGAIGVDWRSPAIATYGMLLVLDTISLVFAARDAATYSQAHRQVRGGASTSGNVQ